VRYVHRHIHDASGSFTSLLHSSYALVPGFSFMSRRFGCHGTKFTRESMRLGGALTSFASNDDFLAPVTGLPSGETITSGLLASHNAADESSAVLNDELAFDPRGRLVGQNRLTYDRGTCGRTIRQIGSRRPGLPGSAAPRIRSSATSAGPRATRCTRTSMMRSATGSGRAITPFGPAYDSTLY
jgi:hypothetical protein